MGNCGSETFGLTRTYIQTRHAARHTTHTYRLTQIIHRRSVRVRKVNTAATIPSQRPFQSSEREMQQRGTKRAPWVPIKQQGIQGGHVACDRFLGERSKSKITHQWDVVVSVCVSNIQGSYQRGKKTPEPTPEVNLTPFASNRQNDISGNRCSLATVKTSCVA